MAKNKQQTWLFNEKGRFLVEENGRNIDMSVNKKTRVNPFTWLFRDNRVYLSAFFLPAGILLLAYALFGVYPFNILQSLLRGEEQAARSVLSLDLNAQYVYYFEYIHDVLRGGENLFYSWSRNLSGEFMGIIGYYLASPFNLLVWVFPRELITEGLLAMIVAKTGAIGVSAAVYLKRGRGLSNGTAVIFSMMYALCSYTIVQTMNPMWLDGVFALPLIAFGVESLVRHGRFRLLIISLAYSFITCFYIGWMLGIFTGIYFIYYLIASRAGEKLDGGAVTARIGLFSISAGTAVMLSAFMLIPVYNSLQQGKLTFTQPDYSYNTNFMLLDLARKLLPGSYDTVRMDGLPFIYCGVLAVLLIPLFFFGGNAKLISIKKRIAGGILALSLILCMYVSSADIIMHGMQFPNWLPYRYSFILSFLLVIWAAEVFDKLEQYSRRAIGASAAAFLAVIAYLESTDTFNETLGDFGRELLDSKTVILPSIAAAVLLVILLSATKHRKFTRHALCVTVGFAVVIELLYSSYLQLNKQDTDIVYSNRGTYTDFIIPLREKVDEIKAEDDGFYRIEKDFFRTVNDPMGTGMYGLSHSSSTLNERAITLLGQLGMTSRGHYTRYSGATPLIDDLFGVKYIFSYDSRGYGEVLDTNKIKVEENIDAMPVAYLTDKRMLSMSLEGHGYIENVFAQQNRLLSAMLGDNQIADYFKLIGEESITKEIQNLTDSLAEGGAYQAYHVITQGENAEVKYTMTAEADGEIFMWLPSKYERRIHVRTNRNKDENGITENIYLGDYFEYDDYCIKSLGMFEEGEEFSVTLTLTRPDLYYTNAYFAYMDAEAYEEAIAELHDMNRDTIVTKNSSTSITILTDAKTEQLLFTTIPDEPGWTVTLDGEEIQPVTVLGGLIGLIVPAGARIIELEYRPAGYIHALGLTGGGVIIFVLLCLMYMKVRKEKGVLSAGGYSLTDPDDVELGEEEIEFVVGEPPKSVFDSRRFTPEELLEFKEEEYLFAEEPESEVTEEPESEAAEEYAPEPEVIEEPEPEPEVTEEPAPELVAYDPDEEYEALILGDELSMRSIADDFREINENIEEEPELIEDVILNAPQEPEPTDDESFFADFAFVPEPEPINIFEVDPEPAEDVVFNAPQESEPAEDVVFNAPQESEPAEDVVFNATQESEPAEDVVFNATQESEPAEEDVVFNVTQEPEPSALPNIDFEARRRALELELMLEAQQSAQPEVQSYYDLAGDDAVLDDPGAAPADTGGIDDEEIPSTSQQFYYNGYDYDMPGVFDEFEFIDEDDSLPPSSL